MSTIINHNITQNAILQRALPLTTINNTTEVLGDMIDVSQMVGEALVDFWILCSSHTTGYVKIVRLEQHTQQDGLGSKIDIDLSLNNGVHLIKLDRSNTNDAFMQASVNAVSDNTTNTIKSLAVHLVAENRHTYKWIRAVFQGQDTPVLNIVAMACLNSIERLPTRK